MLLQKNDRGITLLEVIMSAALFTILALGVARFLQNSRDGLTMLESQGSILGGVQKVLDAIRPNLACAYRIFEENSAGPSYIAKIDGTGLPPRLSGSRLPIIESQGSLTPSASAFVPGSVGNCLFFASANKSFDTTVRRIDLYTFHYYFLTPTAAQFGTSKVRHLWEWHSIRYANYPELASMTAADRTTAIGELIAQNIHMAWDMSKDPDDAFYLMDNAGGMTLAPSTYRIQSTLSGNAIALITGVTGNPYRYSVCPNNTAGEFSVKSEVPRYATAVGADFPSGFEIVVDGPGSAREVLIRLVVVAKSGPRRFLSTEGLSINSVRDVW